MDGILIVDKPLGLTSHDVVDFIRGKFGIKKAGHGGTLDPQAGGLLVILIGQATKLFSKIIDMEKEYIGNFYLGKATDTADSAGKIILEEPDHSKIEAINLRILKEAFSSLKGEFEQTPPMFSALHYKGKRLYELAREGKTVAREARIVKIIDLEITSFNSPLLGFRIVCSRGTYIRSLCDEINKRLNIPAYLFSLKRVRCGNFSLDNSVSMDMLKNSSSLEKFIIPALNLI